MQIKFKNLLSVNCIILLILTLSFCPDLHAAEILRFEKGLEGLSKQIEGNMVRDKQGLLWFCYYGGIGRYDGYEVKYYKTGPGSVSGAATMSIVADDDDALWILTKDNGLNKYDKRTDSFSYFKHDPENIDSLASNSSDNFNLQRLFLGRNGKLLIGTNGGFDIYDKHTNHFTHHKHDPDDPNTLSSDNVTAVMEGKDGIIWVGTSGGGLNKYNPDTGQWTLYQSNPTNPTSISSNIVWSLLEDREGVIWVGTWDQGLNRFDKKTETFKHYKHDPNDLKSIVENKIIYLYEDTLGNIWLTHRESNSAGLEMFNRTNGEFVKYQHDPKTPSTVSSNSISSVFEDPETGIFWVLNTYNGIFDKYDKNSRRFELYQHDPNDAGSIFSSPSLIMHEDRKSRFWVSAQGSLEVLDRKSGKFIHYLHKNIDPSLGHITALHEDNDGTFWMLDVGKLGTLIHFDPDTMKILQRFRHDPEKPESLMINTIPGPGLIGDKNNPDILWIGLSSGLEKFNKRTESFSHFTHNPNDLTSISKGTVWSLWDDGKGSIWVSTFSGLNKFDKHTEKFTRYIHDPSNPDSIGFNKHSCVFEDSIGNLWIAGFTDGMDKFDRKTGIFKHFNHRTGFPATGVNRTIQEDKNGNLWIGTTDAGLLKFNIQTETIEKIYTTSDGLPSNHLWRSYKTSDGKIWFSSPAGLTGFLPDEIYENTYVPPVILTALKQGGEHLHLGKAPELIDSIKLDWTANYFEFQFAALSYTKPEKNQYAYFLQGIDKSWFYSGKNPFGRYTNLPGGEYTLKFKGSNNDGVWNEKGSSIKIVVQSPFWQTSWFYAGLGGMSCLFVVFVAFYLGKLRSEISKREKTAKALQKSETLLSTSQSLAKVGGWQFDVLLAKSFWTDELYRIHEIPNDPDIDHLFESQKCFRPEDRPVLFDAFQRACDNGEPYDLEFPFTTFKKRHLWIRTTAQPVYEDGKVVRVIGNVIDITEGKHAEAEFRQLNAELDQRVSERTAELEATNKELDAFAYSVSHDLRAPVRHIDGFLELLQKKVGTTLDEQGHHYMDTISKSSKKMGLLIDDLLSFSRKGRQAMSFQQVKLENLVREVIQDVEPDGADRKIDWHVGELPVVSGDAAMLRQVLVNLISNAVKYSRPRPRAVIEIGSIPGQEAETVIFVRDNGVGFDINYVDKLFGVFQRLHRADEFEGTGIGLANVHRIIARHGGRTWAEGKIDKGATFYFSLPSAVQET